MAFGQEGYWDYNIARAQDGINQCNLQIADIENQIASIEADNAKLQNMLDDLAIQEAARVIVPPALPPTSAPPPAPAPVIPPYIQAAVAPTPIIAPAAVVAPTREVVTIYVPTPAPAAAVPTPEVVRAYAPAPEARGEPGIAPTPEEVAAATAPEVSLAGMPSWAWILMAGAAVFLLFGGKGIPGEEGKKPRRVRKGRK